MSKIIKVKESAIAQAIVDVVEHCDADTLAKIAGDVLGGNCFYDEDGEYDFEPDENYAGAFDNATKD
jgi:hypothetical protein